MCIYIYIYGEKNIYIYVHICIHIYIYIIIYTYPKVNGLGAAGSKSPPCILEPLFFSARRGSKNSGFVLRPLCPYTVALTGVAVVRPVHLLRVSLLLVGLLELRIKGLLEN